MNIETVLQNLQKALDDGQVEKAAAAVGSSAAEFTKAPRALLPVLDLLDRQKNDDALNAIVTKAREIDILALECSIFDMRLKFRAAKYGEALRAIDKILTLSPDNVEALRTGGRIGNVTKDEGLALRYWDRLARASASDPEAALQAARIYSRRHQHAPALNWAQAAAECRPDLQEPLQIAVSSGLEVGWPENCDALLARLLKLDRPQALKVLARLAQELPAERAASLLSSLLEEFSADQAIADIGTKTYSAWLVAALEQELASRELEAAALYRSARTLQPGNPNPQRALERLSSPSLLAMREAFHGRDFAGAVEHGEMAARINPESTEAWQTVGRAHFTRGNFAEARDSFRRCTELDTKDAQSWLTYGLVLNQAGDRSGALRAFQMARGLADADTKREAEASIAALHPLLVQEANQAAADGDIELAWQASESALQIRRDDDGMAHLRRNLLRQQHNQIRDAWNDGSENVVPLCRSYLDKVPGDVYASTVLGRMLMRSRAYSEALPIWESVCKQSPQDAHALLQVARCCRSIKMREKGLAAAEAALRIDPSLGEVKDLVDFFKSQAPPPPAEPRGRRKAAAR